MAFIAVSPTVSGAAKATMANHLRRFQIARSLSSPPPLAGFSDTIWSELNVSTDMRAAASPYGIRRMLRTMSDSTGVRCKVRWVLQPRRREALSKWIQRPARPATGEARPRGPTDQTGRRNASDFDQSQGG